MHPEADRFSPLPPLNQEKTLASLTGSTVKGFSRAPSVHTDLRGYWLFLYSNQSLPFEREIRAAHFSGPNPLVVPLTQSTFRTPYVTLEALCVLALDGLPSLIFCLSLFNTCSRGLPCWLN